MSETNLTWRDRCQHCGKLRESTRRREFRTKAYQGPCGDSFCFASCEMEVCRPIDVTVCDGCERKLRR